MNFEANVETLLLGNANRKLRSLIHKALKINTKVDSIYRDLIRMNLVIRDMSRAWGTFTPSTGEIALSRDLVRNYSNEAIEYVLTHELAHAIDHYAYGNIDSDVHGYEWVQICTALGHDGKPCNDANFMSQFGESNNKLIEKVKKLMSLSSSNNMNESTSAMNKARALMAKHNLSMEAGCEQWVRRPIGEFGRRSKRYLNLLGNVIQEHYTVRYINNWTWTDEGTMKYVEVFGTRENVDIAEYVCHFILNQANVQWLEYRKSDKFRKGYDRKDSFIYDFIKGYSSKLEEQREYKSDFKLNELIHCAEKKVVDAFNKSYNVTYTNNSYSRRSGGGDGKARGSNLSMRGGLNAGNRNKRIG